MLYLVYGLTVIAFIAVVVTLLMGGAALRSDAEGGRETSNKWMQRRVFAQAIAIALLLLSVYLKNKAG